MVLILIINGYAQKYASHICYCCRAADTEYLPLFLGAWHKFALRGDIKCLSAITYVLPLEIE